MYIKLYLVDRQYLEFKAINKYEIIKGLTRAVNIIKEYSYTKIEFEKDALEDIAMVSDGDMRSALNLLELVTYSTKPNKDNIVYINSETVKNLAFNKKLNYDRKGDSHYDILSAFHKVY